MPLRQSTASLCSFCSAASFLHPAAAASISSRPPPRLRIRRARRDAGQRRHATTITDGPPFKPAAPTAASPDGQMTMPWPTSDDPTPYEILGHARRGPYNKKRYIELVKLYHPDLHRHVPLSTATLTSPPSSTTASTSPARPHVPSSTFPHGTLQLSPASLGPFPSIPAATRLERYRLVVAAHALLSDPSRRAAYDRLGLGWGRHRGSDHHQHHHPAAAAEAFYAAWRREPGSAAMNATWEDWARWREEQRARQTTTQDGGGGGGGGGVGGDDAFPGVARERQQPVYMSNGLFVVVLLAFVAAGGVGQLTRAGAHSSSIVEVRARQHNTIAEDMGRRQRESEGLSREGRVEHFLGRREGRV